MQGGPTGQAGADGAPGAAGAAGADGADATIDTQDRNRLNSVDGLNAKTADLSINSGTPDWNNVTDLANGGFVSHNEIPTSAQAQALTYVLTKTGTATDAGRPFTIIKIINTYDERDIRIRQHLSPETFFISNWHHIGDNAGFSYFYSHHNLFQGYDIHIQHNDEIAGTDTAYRGDVGDGTFAAPDGTGNLADTVDTIDEFVTAVDDLTLGGGGGGGGTVTTSAPVSGDGSAGDPVTIANQAIGHTKIGSSVGGVDQAAGRILEADGAGDVRWADKGGGTGTDEYSDSLSVDITGQTLTVTVGRTGSLIDLVRHRYHSRSREHRVAAHSG